MIKRNRLRSFEGPLCRIVWMGGGGGNAQTDAATQMQFNQQAAMLGQRLNRYNIDSPYGTSTFRGQTLVERLRPGQRKIFKQRQKADLLLAQQAARQAEQYGEFQTSNASELARLRQSELGAATSRAGARSDVLARLRATQAGAFDPSDEYRLQGVDDLRNVEGIDENLGRTQVEEALFSRLNPQFDRDRGALEARLAAQGISPGSEAYVRGMDELRRSQTDARFQATAAGGQEHSRLRGLRTSELERRRALRQQILQELLARRGLPFDELSALEG